MSVAARVLGGAMLLHSIYSLRELGQISAPVQRAVPQDVVWEAAIGAIIIIISIYWNLDFKLGKISDALAAEESSEQSRFLHLETRARFQDIRAKRAQHLQWKQTQ